MNEILETTYNLAFDLIEVRLNKREEVAPFVVTLGRGHSRPEVHMYEPVAENAADQLEVIRKDLRKTVQEGEIVALCLCFTVGVIDPRTDEKVDAIQMELADGETGTINIYIPYDFNDTVFIKKPFQTPSTTKFFNVD